MKFLVLIDEVQLTTFGQLLPIGSRLGPEEPHETKMINKLYDEQDAPGRE